MDSCGSVGPGASYRAAWLTSRRAARTSRSWHLGRRNTWDTHDFMEKLAAATAGRFQLTTDGLNTYPDSVEYNFGARVDYAQLVKEFGAEGGEEQRRYAPPRLIGAEKIAVAGDPDEARICTSHIERSNWTLRGHLRRMTRLSNGFSRKRANLRAALALYFAYYNFCRMHKEHPHDSGNGGRPDPAPVEHREPAGGCPGSGRLRTEYPLPGRGLDPEVKE